MAGSLLALVDGLETAARCDSAVLSPFQLARSPSITKMAEQRAFSLWSRVGSQRLNVTWAESTETLVLQFKDKTFVIERIFGDRSGGTEI